MEIEAELGLDRRISCSFEVAVDRGRGSAHKRDGFWRRVQPNCKTVFNESIKSGESGLIVTEELVKLADFREY